MNAFTDELERLVEAAVERDLKEQHAHLSREAVRGLMDFRSEQMAITAFQVAD